MDTFLNVKVINVDKYILSPHRLIEDRSIFFYYLYCMLSHIIINKEKKIGPLLQREGQVVFIKVAAGIWEGK